MAKKTSTTKKTKSPSSTTDHHQPQQEDLPPSAGYLIRCDVPTKQFIQYLNELKPVDKKFIIQDLDPTHLLVKRKAKEEISQRVEAWLDENVFSAVERVGEDLDMS
jgi:TFIIH basal transcription factor complex TTD-A subunit